MKRYALLGAKLSHSFSPLIHNEIFKDMNIDASYHLIECESFELNEIISKLKSGEYSGYNVTIPYKKEVMKYLDEISKEALEIGSVNTIALINGKTVGFNTDYYGFYNELLHFNVEVNNKECYVLGTGGASLAINKALKDLGGNVYNVSRNPKNGEISYDDLKDKNIDVIVNTTPVGMYPNVLNSPLPKDIVIKANYVLDIIFNPRVTKLLEYANSNMDGLYMLLGQAIKAEEIWQNKIYNSKIEELLKRIEVKLSE
ncbi:MAG: shikimate dehydrogenase [Acholeplasmatales bacterium]|nr:shikimate dehydrogenase [Acholeplasmatales bacterium]